MENQRECKEGAVVLMSKPPQYRCVDCGTAWFCDDVTPICIGKKEIKEEKWRVEFRETIRRMWKERSDGAGHLESFSWSVFGEDLEVYIDKTREEAKEERFVACPKCNYHLSPKGQDFLREKEIRKEERNKIEQEIKKKGLFEISRPEYPKHFTKETIELHEVEREGWNKAIFHIQDLKKRIKESERYHQIS